MTLLNKARDNRLLVDLSLACETVKAMPAGAYRNAIQEITLRLRSDNYRHVIFDLQNEFESVGCDENPTNGDRVATPLSEIVALRNAVKAVDPLRLVTASESWATPRQEVVDHAITANLDFVAFHEDRPNNWHELADDVVADLKSRLGCPSSPQCRPVYLQEPAYNETSNQFSAQSFIDAARNTKSAGGAAWTFHTDAGFWLKNGVTLYGQLDSNERSFLDTFNPSVTAQAWEGDNLLDTWAAFFGIPGYSASWDSDADGRTNSQEFLAGTHPRSSPVDARYFAEGSTQSNAANGATFQTGVFLTNVNTTDSTILLRFLREDGVNITTTQIVQGQRTAFVDVGTLPGLAAVSFSTVVEPSTGSTIVADRTMKWSGYGSHSEKAIVAPATTWLFAEGATHSGFDLYYLLQNPNDYAVTAHATYYFPNGTSSVADYIVPALSRVTISGNAVLGSNVEVSAQFTVLGGAKIIAERAMYFQGSWTAGHGSAGVNGARTAWYFAEGSTGSFFDSFFLLLNSNAQPAAVRGTYRLGSGAVIQRDYFVNANSRFNIWVNTEPGLSDAAFSLELQSIPNGSGQTLPIVAERAMWWPRSPAWYEAHNSPGEAGAGTMWAMSGGEVNLGASEETYVLINNASGFAAAVDVTAILPSGTVTRSYYIPANSRFNVPMSVYFPESNGTRFGVLVRSTNSAQLVVERSVYANGGGVSWTVGANAFGTRLQ